MIILQYVISIFHLVNDETDDEGYGSILSDSSPSNKQGTTIYNL